MGGLASALALAKAGQKNITIYENAPNLGFVGAGIQLAPNMARILDKFGCWERIAAEAVQCANTSIREGSSDKELGYVDLGYVKERYGYPHMVGHRASLAGGLYEGCQREASITFKLGSLISDVKFGPKPSFKVTPANVLKLSKLISLIFATRMMPGEELKEVAEVRLVSIYTQRPIYAVFFTDIALLRAWCPWRSIRDHPWKIAHWIGRL